MMVVNYLSIQDIIIVLILLIARSVLSNEFIGS